MSDRPSGGQAPAFLFCFRDIESDQGDDAIPGCAGLCADPSSAVARGMIVTR